VTKIIELEAAQTDLTQLDALREFAATLDDSQLRDLLLSVSGCVRVGTDITLFERDAELTPNQVSAGLRMSRTHIYKLLDSGELPSVQVGRDRRIRVADVVAFEARRQDARRRFAERFAHTEQNRDALIDELADEI